LFHFGFITFQDAKFTAFINLFEQTIFANTAFTADKFIRLRLVEPVNKCISNKKNIFLKTCTALKNAGFQGQTLTKFKTVTNISAIKDRNIECKKPN